MKKVSLLIIGASLMISSCKKANSKPSVSNPKVIIDSVVTNRVVKAIKEDNITTTDYEYKYDWVGGKFRQQPTVNSEMKYFIVFTNGDIEETTKKKGMFYEKGDKLRKVEYIYSK